MDAVRIARLVASFLIAGALLGGGVLAYWQLGLVVGLAGVAVSVIVAAVAGYDTYRFASAA
ncbi:hypothetical protein [Haloarcula litorea]|uniref:hypothetical protein n=1 Tax=Haloarcula litorea TaxID=3032579 RepID=UPI0023E8D38B|nr:hypothetical protein [Halomicroarcula sp. GDY20]